jgi:hypothetical protein
MQDHDQQGDDHGGARFAPINVRGHLAVGLCFFEASQYLDFIALTRAGVGAVAAASVARISVPYRARKAVSQNLPQRAPRHRHCLSSAPVAVDRNHASKGFGDVRTSFREVENVFCG